MRPPLPDSAPPIAPSTVKLCPCFKCSRWLPPVCCVISLKAVTAANCTSPSPTWPSACPSSLPSELRERAVEALRTVGVLREPRAPLNPESLEPTCEAGSGGANSDEINLALRVLKYKSHLIIGIKSNQLPADNKSLGGL